jgi:hypothetical protein
VFNELLGHDTRTGDPPRRLLASSASRAFEVSLEGGLTAHG